MALGGNCPPTRLVVDQGSIGSAAKSFVEVSENDCFEDYYSILSSRDFVWGWKIDHKELEAASFLTQHALGGGILRSVGSVEADGCDLKPQFENSCPFLLERKAFALVDETRNLHFWHVAAACVEFAKVLQYFR